MRLTSLAALLAAPVLLAFPGTTPANPPKQCYAPLGGCSSGFCLSLFSRMHQHGPLFNYGPYYGYPPFEPYGAWNAYLQYNPWYYGGQSGGHGHGHGYSDKAGHGGICNGGGWHGSWLHGGWFHGRGCASCGDTSLFHGHGAPAGGCAGCKAAAFNPTTTDPLTRYAGVGSPADAAGFYSGLPTIYPTGVAPAGGIAK
jgi:hypothetical protein